MIKAISLRIIIEMIKHSSSGGDSSSAARQCQATSSAALDEDHASSVPSMLPINLIAALILPFLDRSTWNSVCSANKELWKAGKRMRPPWPNTTLNVGGTEVLAVAFSPCESFLACTIVAQNVIQVWDRHGEQTQLAGHTNDVTCLKYSLDGRYLASGSSDGLVRLWRTVTSESAAHSSSSDASQSDIIILLGHEHKITALTFSPTDSNLLASGCKAGDIKLWDVTKQVCIHAFNPRLAGIEVIFFAPGDHIRCYVVTLSGPMIRLERKKKRNKRLEFAHTILEEPSLGIYPLVAFSPCGTRFAAMSYMGNGFDWELSLYKLKTMAKTQSVVVSGDHCNFAGIAMSPNGKKLVTTGATGRILLFESHDLNIQKYVDNLEHRSNEAQGLWPVTFDPTSRLYAVGCVGGRVELRNF
jgi:WD40 repeat protein